MKSRHKLTIFHGKFIDIPSLKAGFRIRSSCAIGVNSESGSIVFIQENFHDDLLKLASNWNPNLKPNEVRIVDCNNNNNSNSNSYVFLFPGFVDTHIHASQYPNNGLFGKMSLLEWLNEYTFPLENKLKDLNIAKIVYSKVIERTLSHGTTTAAYYATIHLESTKLLASLCSEYNQRSFIGKMCMNQNSPAYYVEPSTDSSISLTKKFIEHVNNINNPKINAIISPRFAPSCDEDLLCNLGKLAKQYELPIQIHLSENLDELEWVHDLFPEYSNYTEVYNQNGLLNEKTILAHCIYLNDLELNTIKSKNSGIAHCPISNSCLSSGLCPVRKILNKGIKVGLGTDTSAGYTTSILEVARHAHMVSRQLASVERNDDCKISVTECLYLATLGGAYVMGLQDQVGSFEVNKQFDGQLINLTVEGSKIDLFPWDKETEKLEKWFFNGDDRNVQAVWVGGQECGIRSKSYL